MRVLSPELPPTPNPSQGEIVAPARSYGVVSEEPGLLILPDLWKTPARISRVSHRSLDGANGRAAHRPNRPYYWSLSTQERRNGTDLEPPRSREPIRKCNCRWVTSVVDVGHRCEPSIYRTTWLSTEYPGGIERRCVGR
jgi:hypothetical protein